MAIVRRVSTLPRRLLGRLLRARGLVVERIDEDAWLLQRGDSRRQVHRIGPAKMRTHVVTDADTLRNHMNGYQNQMGQHLGEEHLAWVFRELAVNCVLDVGANTGQFASRLRRAGYTGRIVSFEPVSHLVTALQRAAARDPAWTVLPFALGDEDGTAEINVVPGKMSSLLPASSFGKEWSSKLREPHTETITIRRLESVYDEAVAGLEEPRVFLKMDTQGYDLQTVRGAGPRLEEVVGLQSEVSCVPIYDGMPRLPEQLTEYEAAGFAISAMFPVTRHRATLRAIEFDVVMVRPEAVVGAGRTPPERARREHA
jgi:FkbM family methyltransferase